jgi:hypothetical protein
MKNKTEQIEDVLGCKNIESLLLMAVLGDSAMRQHARRELSRRRVINSVEDFEDSFMTNLSVV